MARLRESKEMVLFAVSSVLLLAGGVAWLLAAGTPARVLWITGTVLGLVFSVSWVAGAIRRHQPSVDVIAVLALAGALAVGEPFAGAVITVMLASGQLLEARASARARRELSLLAERAPRTARRRVGGGVVEVAVDNVVRGDRLLVGAGGIVPVDGRLLSPAVLDESALTGESLLAERIAGEDVRSGVVNAGQPIELVATAAAAESTYAGVVRLVEQAQASSAPFVRTADRFAVLFVPLTLALAAAAWALSADPVRAVAVLVVATPCPLLLAAPIAIMSGLSRAARTGVVVKGGGALERLAAGRVMLFDKTGTLTQGRPGLAGVVTAAGRMDADELLRLAASLDQVSAHVLASAIVTAATSRGLALEMQADVREVHGYGLEGTVGGHRVRLGKATWIVGGEPPRWVRQVRRRADLDGSLTVFAAVDDGPAGAFLLDDPIRPDAPRMVRALRDGRHHACRPGHRRPRGHRGDGRARRGRRHRAGRLRPRGQAQPRSNASRRTARRSWSETGSTTLPRSRRPAPGWPSPPAGPPRRPRRPTSFSRSTGSTPWPTRSSSRAVRSGSPCRPSSSAWACRSPR